MNFIIIQFYIKAVKNNFVQLRRNVLADLYQKLTNTQFPIEILWGVFEFSKSVQNFWLKREYKNHCSAVLLITKKRLDWLTNKTVQQKYLSSFIQWLFNFSYRFSGFFKKKWQEIFAQIHADILFFNLVSND